MAGGKTARTPVTKGIGKMTPSWRCWFWKLGLASLLGMGGAITSSGDCARAQIRPDNTLGRENSQVTSTGSVDQIDGGATRSANLFHSFREFSVPTGGAAYFNNALDIQNIISRVTGKSISNIDGLIAANGTANLFLLNPNGIIFGPNASLNIGGSFLGSTASSLNFADGKQFSATAPQTTPLLTVSAPLGLQFGGNAGSILVQGNGQGLRTTTDLIDTTVGLRVQPNQTLALVGGDVALEGGTLKTAGGRIELGSVAGPGLVSLIPIDFGWSLGYEGVQNFQDIQLSQQAAVDASGAGGGDIQVWGKRVTLTNGSQIEASTLGSKPGGTLEVIGSESVELNGSGADSSSTGLFAQVYPGATGTGGNLTIEAGRLSVTGRAGANVATFGEGKGGDLTLETGQLIVRDGAQIGANTFGAGPSGSLVVRASDSVELIGTSANGQFVSGLINQVYPRATGTGGNLTLETGRLIVRDGATVNSNTLGAGKAGNLTIRVSDSVELIGISADGRFASGLGSQVYPEATGAGGNLKLETERLIVRNGAKVGTDTFGAGSGGSLSVRASESVELIGESANGEAGSVLSTQTNPGATGAGGNLIVETGRLIVRDGAQIGTSTFGAGPSGDLTVRASDSVDLTGTSAFNSQFASALSTGTQPGATGTGGNLIVETGRLIVRNGAGVGTSTLGAGRGGNLTVRASDSVKLIGTSADGRFPSLLVAQTESGGDAGDLTIATGQLTVRDEGVVSVSSEGLGNAGKLEVSASSIRLENQASLSSNTRAGQGNIFLRSGDLVLRRGSDITTNATGTATGGNITLNTDILAALENSDITANASEGPGGRVIINAQGIFGTEFRNQLTSESDITATSNLGPEFSGTVEINTPDVDPSQGLATLPAQLVEASGLIAAGCAALGENKFIVTGRGGLPENPTDPLSSDAVQVDLVTLNSREENRSSPPVSTNPTAPAPLVEAQGWMINNLGEVVLTAHAPNATPHIPWLPSATCHTP